jgi:hypothetical protein
MTSLTNEEVLAELYYTQKAIKLTTGLTPKYWRPVSHIYTFINSELKFIILFFF